MKKAHLMDGVREYSEAYPVGLVFDKGSERWCIEAWNEGHNNNVRIDIVDVLEWACRNIPSKEKNG